MTHTVILDGKACKECGYCKVVCPMDVFEKGTEFNAKGYRYYIAANAQKCIGCKKCFYACPDFAISIQENED